MKKAVIGMAFGDEGKGMFTDYLCSQEPNSLVIRFSGGHQCGHTVVKDNIRHIFSSFGSGTLRDCPTYWTSNCTVEPIALVNELSVLLDKGIKPLLYLNLKCPVTTPYDIQSNRENIPNLIHGSCGVGFGATIERESKNYSLTVLDLFFPKILKERLELIRKFYDIDKKINLDTFFKCCEILSKSKCILPVESFPKYNYKQYVFEGSQGLLLDQKYGFFPNVTRSNTGSKNLPKEKDMEYFLITRAYQTRHGSGFMTNEDIDFMLEDNSSETNVTNQYQGNFRKSMLDLSLLEYAIRKDRAILNSQNKRLVITCLDHLKEYKFSHGNDVFLFDNKDEFIYSISELLDIRKVYTSESNDSKVELRDFSLSHC